MPGCHSLCHHNNNTTWYQYQPWRAVMYIHVTPWWMMRKKRKTSRTSSEKIWKKGLNYICLYHEEGWKTCSVFAAVTGWTLTLEHCCVQVGNTCRVMWSSSLKRGSSRKKKSIGLCDGSIPPLPLTIPRLPHSPSVKHNHQQDKSSWTRTPRCSPPGALQKKNKCLMVNERKKTQAIDKSCPSNDMRCFDPKDVWEKK